MARNEYSSKPIQWNGILAAKEERTALIDELVIHIQRLFARYNFNLVPEKSGHYSYRLAEGYVTALEAGLTRTTITPIAKIVENHLLGSMPSSVERDLAFKFMDGIYKAIGFIVIDINEGRAVDSSVPVYLSMQHYKAVLDLRPR